LCMFGPQGAPTKPRFERTGQQRRCWLPSRLRRAARPQPDR
jgi:hypothetical protein